MKAVHMNNMYKLLEWKILPINILNEF